MSVRFVLTVDGQHHLVELFQLRRRLQLLCQAELSTELITLTGELLELGEAGARLATRTRDLLLEQLELLLEHGEPSASLISLPRDLCHLLFLRADQCVQELLVLSSLGARTEELTFELCDAFGDAVCDCPGLGRWSPRFLSRLFRSTRRTFTDSFCGRHGLGNSFGPLEVRPHWRRDLPANAMHIWLRPELCRRRREPRGAGARCWLGRVVVVIIVASGDWPRADEKLHHNLVPPIAPAVERNFEGLGAQRVLCHVELGCCQFLEHSLGSAKVWFDCEHCNLEEFFRVISRVARFAREERRTERQLLIIKRKASTLRLGSLNLFRSCRLIPTANLNNERRC